MKNNASELYEQDLNFVLLNINKNAQKSTVEQLKSAFYVFVIHNLNKKNQIYIHFSMELSYTKL